MKIIILALSALVLVGCATPPATIMSPRSKVVLSQRAFDEIAAARSRELALYALSHIGVPYRYGGSSPESGFDCSGLVHYVYSRASGLVLPRSAEALSAIGVPV